MHRNIPIQRYEGDAGVLNTMAAFAVFAGYSPANVVGALGATPAFALGVCHVTAAQMGEELHGLRTQLQAKMAAARNEDGTYNFDALDVEAVNRLNDDIGAKAKTYEEAKRLEVMAENNEAAIAAGLRPVDLKTHPALGGISGSGPVRSFKSILTGVLPDVYREVKAKPRGARYTIPIADLTGAEAERTFGLKTIVTLTEAPADPGPRRAPVLSAQEERTVADLMLPGTMDTGSFTYLEETTFTNAAATVAEAGTKPESALAFTERTITARKIATWIPATDEVFGDVSGFDSYVRGRLSFMVERTEEVQLLTGNGTPPNLRGVNNATGVQSQAKGADPTPDAVFKAMTLVRDTGFAEPTAAVFHPNDWQDIRLLRTADGIYIFGNPTEASPERIWGLEVRITTAQTENTGLVGAFRPFTQIFRREGITISVSTEHSTYFVENKVAILAEERLALAIYRGAAFAKVTGI